MTFNGKVKFLRIQLLVKFKNQPTAEVADESMASPFQCTSKQIISADLETDF
jgi:hypothetical protein